MENTENKPKRKVTRKIKKFDFSDENATVSLVGDSVGGPANGVLTLITKSKKNVSEEFLKKASQITVTMSINEYLQRFFGLWVDDAELLARSLGFSTEGMDKAILEQQEEMLEDQEPPEQPDCWEDKPGDSKYEKWINYKLQSIQVMKALFEAENIEEAIINLSEEDYLQVLQDQEIVEKAFVEIDKACGKGKGGKPIKKNSSANAGDNSTNNASVEIGGDISPVVKNKNKENSMTEKVEVVEKAQFEAIQKQLKDQKVELEKALEEIEKYRIEKATAIAKARKEQITKACGKHAEVIFKAVGECEEETFVEVVKALSEMQELAEKSALFQEQGASVSDGEVNQESNLAKVIKAKYSNKQ